MCPWTLVRSWEHLPFSFLFSPSPLLPWVSQDAFVIAGSPSCVVAGSTFVSSFLSFFFLPPFPRLFPRARRAYKQTNKASATGFSMRLVCHRLVPFHLVPLSLAPTDVFPLFFYVFLSSCFFILIPSFSCAHFRPDLSLYTYTHAFSTYNEVQVAQVCYNEVRLIGCPSSLGFSSSATTHTFCLSRLSHFHLSPLRAHVFRITPFPGRMGVPPFGQDGGHTYLPSGCVCVSNLWSHKAPFGVLPFTAGTRRQIADRVEQCYAIWWGIQLAQLDVPASTF